MTWVEALRSASMLDVAARLGLSTAPPRGSSGGVIYRCPSCGAERARASQHVYSGGKGVLVRKDGRGGRCAACDVSFDPLALVCAALGGKRRYKELAPEAQARVRVWCVEHAARADASTSTRTTSASPPPPPMTTPPPRSASHPPVPLEQASPPPLLPESKHDDRPTYPPDAELKALFGPRQWRRTADDPEVLAWLLRKVGGDTVVALDMAHRIDDLELACALRVTARLPEWATFGQRRWTLAGYRVLIPLIDARGVGRSVIARNTFASAKVKSVPPRGYERRGLVMACPLARGLLQHGKHPSRWPASKCDPFGAFWPQDRPLYVDIYEGESDYLLGAARYSEANEDVPASLGIFSGAWSSEVADRIPDHAIVTVIQDRDQSGRKYTDRIIESFVGRDMELRIWTPPAVNKEPSADHAKQD